MFGVLENRERVTVRAVGLRGTDGYAYIVVNRQENGDVILRRETDGERATLGRNVARSPPPGLGCVTICRRP